MPTPETSATARVTTNRETCTHSRLIDEVRKTSGELTGNVRCLECQAILIDPCRRPA
jgi:hypothetical protein